MGNKLGRRRQVVDERYTKPQGLYVHKDVDHKKLRKLILESKLAPCYPGDDDFSNDHEECPICFLYYPSLNRSRCCMKGICTECFLQMKNPNSTRPTQCPFCKTSNYAVEYRGVKTKEEKGMEQVEEQRVIEAKIRMRQQEIQDEEERIQKRLERSCSSASIAPVEIERGLSADQSFRSPVQNEDVVSSQHSIRHPPPHPPHYRVNRDDEFDVDLEDIMVMEAIWLSIQENGRQKSPAAYSEVASCANYGIQSHYPMPPSSSSSSSSSLSSPSGGLACAIAALAERQQTAADSNENMPPCNMMVQGNCSFYNSTTARDDVEWCADTADAGPSFTSSHITELPPSDNTYRNNSGAIVPESFEEQMMLAMAVSLAEAHGNHF